MGNTEQDFTGIEYQIAVDQPATELVIEQPAEQEIPIEWQWERLRLKRDGLLKKCDYRIVADAPWDTQPWLEYRQTLRDLPKTNNDPKLIVFPNPPA
jgi:hypothetical protein